MTRPGNEAATPIAEYRHGWALRILNLLLTLPAGLGGLVLPWVVSSADDSVAVGIRLGITLLLGVAPLMLFSVVWWRGFVFRLAVFPDRIELHDVFGTRIVPLNHSLKITHRNEQHRLNGIPTAKHIFITFENAGVLIKADSNVSNVNQLQLLALQLEEQFVLPALQSRYNAGGAVTFGPLTIEGERLKFKNKSESLAALQVEIQQGYFVAKKAGSWWWFARVKLSEIPNSATLMTLVRARVQSPVPA